MNNLQSFSGAASPSTGEGNSQLHSAVIYSDIAYKVCCNDMLCLQGVMVRLMLVLAPVACVLSGIGISSILSTYMKVFINLNSSAIKLSSNSINLILSKDVLFDTLLIRIF